MSVGRDPIELDDDAVLGWRMARQGFSEPATCEADYVALFGRLQPVAPVHNSMPGSPPRLIGRTRLDDADMADGLRARAELVKGRFGGGTIGYVLARDLELHGAAFRRGLPRLNPLQEQVYAALRAAGPLTPRQLKEETGLLNKQLTPALHRLQQAFLVYEAQEDSSWERPWSLFEAEWPDVELGRHTWDGAASTVLTRLLHSQVHLGLAQLRDGTGFALRDLRRLAAALEGQGAWVAARTKARGAGWVCVEDVRLSQRSPARSVAVLHKSDPLVRSHASELKARYPRREVLRYLLVDGEFGGAVCGHWRIGPHDVEDVVLDLGPDEARLRRDEVLAAVGATYRPPHSRILRYNGTPL